MREGKRKEEILSQPAALALPLIPAQLFRYVYMHLCVCCSYPLSLGNSEGT